MIEYLKNLFKLPSAAVVAQRELEDARREYLRAQSQSELARSLVDYHDKRIKRLEAYMRAAAVTQ